MKKNKYYYLTKVMSKQAIAILPALLKLSYYTKKQKTTGLNDENIGEDLKPIIIKLLNIMQCSSQVYYEALNDLSMIEADDIQQECENRLISIEDFNDKIHEMKDFCYYQLLFGAISENKEINYSSMYKTSDILALVLSINNEMAFEETCNAFGIAVPEEFDIHKSILADDVKLVAQNRTKLINEYHNKYVENSLNSKIKNFNAVSANEVVDLFTKSNFANKQII